MKNLNTFFIVTLMFSLTANAQITKGNWMVGGSGSLTVNNYKYYDYNNKKFVTDKGFGLQVMPNIGYFIFNKFAGGIVMNYGYGESKDDNGGSGFSRYANIGPFVRYYFLDEEKMINIFLQASYDSTLYNKQSKKTRLASKAGTVIFLNDIVGLEVSLEYSRINFQYTSDPIYDNISLNNVLQLGIGFQIHLERK